MEASLLWPLEASLQTTTHTYCGRASHLFTKRLKQSIMSVQQDITQRRQSGHHFNTAPWIESYVSLDAESWIGGTPVESVSWMTNRLGSTLNHHHKIHIKTLEMRKSSLWRSFYVFFFWVKPILVHIVSVHWTHNQITNAFSPWWKMYWIHFALQRFWTS